MTSRIDMGGEPIADMAVTGRDPYSEIRYGTDRAATESLDEMLGDKHLGRWRSGSGKQIK